ncbi:unnamed protein product [Adineta steineri]|uniref:Uncharacterized protein n=1 Tax=Adineta steineri TaxID=433720 RepID=A0A815LT42_9BILA|nr:unnamed protein product [Adineta steineri]CAF1287630.1 unnamed protein product [Adineta steineri]CAF1376088.1 unnamed protein product [Adineta steineri]CAF1408368.1 unnamed protein product [Adineta steineri]
MNDDINIFDVELINKHTNEFNILYRKLTSTDVDQALHTLKTNQTSSQQQTIFSNNEFLTILNEQECSCCRLLRTNIPNRSSLPLARRGRPHFSTRPHHLLCSNCTEIKRQQQIDILQNQQQQHRPNHISQITINLNISPEEQNALNNHPYETDQILNIKVNTSNGNTIDVSYDTNSLNEHEKKLLVEQTINKLQMILNNRTTTMTDINHESIEFTYRTLETTINILSSSSHNLI